MTRLQKPASGGRRDWSRGLVTCGVVAAAALVPLVANPWGFNPFGPVKALLLSVCALLVATGLALDRARIAGLWGALRSSWIGRCIAVLWLLLILGTITSVEPFGSVFGRYPEYQGLVSWLAVTTVGLGACSLQLSRDWVVLARAVAVVTVLIGAYALCELAGWHPISLGAGAAEGRVAATLGNPSNLGVFVLLSLPLAVERLRSEKVMVWRIVAGVAVVSGLFMLLFSGSRGAWIGLVVSAVLWAAVEIRWRLKRGSRRDGKGKLAMVVLLTLIALVTTVAAVPRLRDRVGQTATSTVQWRLIAWKAAGGAALDRPLLGWGPDSFEVVYTSYWPTAVQADAAHAGAVSDPHNIVASAMVSLGFPGGLAVVALGVATVVGCVGFIKRREGPDLVPVAVAAALLGGSAALMFHYLTLDTAPLLAILMGMVIGARTGSAKASAGVFARVARAGVVVLAIVMALVTVAACGLVGADIALRRAFVSVAESPWSEVKSHVQEAQSLAPWEPAFQWATGKVAVQAIGSGVVGGDQAYVDGVQALETVKRDRPWDEAVTYDLAYLKMTEGIATQGRALIEEARDTFSDLCAADANDPTHWSALAIAEAALGERGAAIDDIGTALVLAPRTPEYRRLLERLQGQ